MKHTPIPWIVSFEESPLDFQMELTIVSGCKTICNFLDSKEEDFANAKLITEAINTEGAKETYASMSEEINRLEESNAELLSALKRVMLWIDSWSPEFSNDEDWPIDRDSAKSAIAKATGKTK